MGKACAVWSGRGPSLGPGFPPASQPHIWITWGPSISPSLTAAFAGFRLVYRLPSLPSWSTASNRLMKTGYRRDQYSHTALVSASIPILSFSHASARQVLDSRRAGLADRLRTAHEAGALPELPPRFCWFVTFSLDVLNCCVLCRSVVWRLLVIGTCKIRY